MALTFITQPPRWASAQKPVLFEFDYQIVLPALDPSNNAYLGSYLTYNQEGKLSVITLVDDNSLFVGDSFYVASGTTLLYPRPVTLLSKRNIVFGGGDLYTEYTTATDFAGGYYTDFYTLDFVESFNPSFRLYIDDSFIENIRYDQDVNGVYRFNLSPYLRRYFRQIGFPGMSAGVMNTLFHKYRIDYIINNITTTGEDKYILNSMQQPLNPECADSLPDWQFDLSTLKCEQDSPRSNSNRVAKMKDMNPNSLSYNQYRDNGSSFYYDSDSGLCPLTYSNIEKSLQFRRNNCGTGKTGSFVTYTVPAGTYTSEISQQDANSQADADIAANGQNYANANGTCSTINASFEYRAVGGGPGSTPQTVYGGTGIGETYADVYINFPAGGPITFYYDVTDTYTQIGGGSETHTESKALTGTQVLVAGNVLMYRSVPATDDAEGYEFTRSYTNLRNTP